MILKKFQVNELMKKEVMAKFHIKGKIAKTSRSIQKIKQTKKICIYYPGTHKKKSKTQMIEQNKHTFSQTQINVHI